ncbi:hypothetical protein [Stenotrophomonas maltophilia]|uniref:hypothetical protein n=3 Tax=Stenotrophomonas TaxID=40323 RepID=UPI00066DBDBE|nr:MULTISPECIES: hypothetical protein [Stenotrophomonas]KOQ63501.1 hypothetical protein ABW41_07415 [Stenotrophomonas maltophilia]KOQ68492.1 hypothetical protein ABW43_13655 [Stenotrophomonas maltophilia]KOQ75007.1 hypothetical protein ABW45_14495 [Stenotrophomonas maltophilia]MDH2063768.1 hypothetical protein [Stenotrophomonas maltophilia]OCK47687.1 hypothetical protein BA766_06460 [Stenotrophomonas maltophilia]
MTPAGTVQLDLPRITATLQRGVRRVAAFMSLGLNAARSATPASLELAPADTRYHFIPTNLSHEAVAHIADEFQLWILTNGVRELCAFLERYLHDLYLAAALISLSQGGRLPPDAPVPTVPTAFEHTGIGRKLELLRETFGIDAPHSDCLSTFWDARNCLVHRLGLVGPKDLVGGREHLLVKWIGLDLWLHPVGGEPQLMPLDLGEGIFLRDGGEVQARTVERLLTFELGHQVGFTAHQLSEMLVTALGQCEALMQSLHALAASKGLLDNPPPATSASSDSGSPAPRAGTTIHEGEQRE